VNLHAGFAAKILPFHIVLDETRRHRRAGKSIVFTNGCFDLLHVGHLCCLEEAAQQGDVLIVAVNSDASMRRLKGLDRPVMDQGQRAAMLAALGCVDHVTIFEADTPCELIEQLQPDVVVKGGTTQEVVGRELVERYGGRIHLTSTIANISTTQIIKNRLS
jgi:D-beta-D-heptose 7-phosphate kinase/D-beta-D-heptose 1-phosphate adenosyltransferase